MNRRLEYWNSIWRWWHYTTVYLGFIWWFILPFTIVLCTLIIYPFMTTSIPTILFAIGCLAILAFDAATNNPFRAIYKPIGTLLQVQIVICYSIYFALLDYMATINQNDEHEKQWFQNMEVLWGLYDTNKILKSQAEGQADDIANVLIPIIPLFAILLACFIYKELDKWFRTNFDVTVIADYRIERESRRIEIKRERDIRRKNKEVERKLREEVLAFGKSSDADSKKDEEGKEEAESKKEEAEEKKDEEIKS
jgi:hypothetical protein